MAHEIEQLVDGSYSTAYVGQKPWHGLGTELEEGVSPQEMMKAAGVDWRVRELATYAEMKVDGKKRRLPTGMKALVRETDGKVLTQVGKNWHPVQNEEAFEFFSEFVNEGHMSMNTAGSLKDGQIVWALAKVEDEFELFDGDRVKSHLLFTNPHQYGKTVDVRFTPIRVVCNNTLSMALSGANINAVKLNHRQAFDPEQVKELMGIAKFKLTKYREAAEFLGSKRTTEDTMKEYFGELLGRSKKEGKELSRNGMTAMQVVDTQPGAEYAKGTFWQAFNAVTFMTDHVMGRGEDTRLTSAWYGANAKLKQDALQLALDMAEKA